MVCYHNVLVFTSGLDRKASTIVCVEITQRFIPDFYFLGLDER